MYVWRLILYDNMQILCIHKSTQQLQTLETTTLHLQTMLPLYSDFVKSLISK